MHGGSIRLHTAGYVNKEDRVKTHFRAVYSYGIDVVDFAAKSALRRYTKFFTHNGQAKVARIRLKEVATSDKALPSKCRGPSTGA